MNKSISTCILAALLLISGCAPGSGPGQNGKNVPKDQESGIDTRSTDPAILAKDFELHKGDLGIDDKPGYIPQNGASFIAPKGAAAQHHTKKEWWKLHEVYPNPAISPSGGDRANNVVAFGSLFFGTPYEYGSNRDNPKTFDCSDFVRWAYLGALGMDLPKDSRSQRKYVETFSKRKYTEIRQAKKGDILFFMSYKGWRERDYRGINPLKETTTHCGIYLGNGRMLHTASKATGGVRIDNIFDRHYSYRFQMGGSVLP